MTVRVKGTPHDFPVKDSLTPETTALLVIDMQHDFLSANGYMHRSGCDLTCLREAIEPLRQVLAKARQWGCRIVYTREGYADDLSDIQPWKLGGTPGDKIPIGDRGPLGRALIRGERGFEIIPELAPNEGETVVDKPSYGAFVTTDLGNRLSLWGIRNLVLTGVTTDCCVTSTLREALDRGFDCMVIEDCVGSANRSHHEAALTLMRKPSGVFGTTATSSAFIKSISDDLSVDRRRR
jgi:biuret amidohydrolase